MPYQHKITDPHSEEASHPESLQFWIHITNYCNLACQYCFVEGKAAGAWPTMSLTSLCGASVQQFVGIN